MYAQKEGLGVIEIGGDMSQGKTLSAVALVIDMVFNKTYSAQNVISNVEIKTLGIPRRDNAEIVNILERMVKDEIMDHLFLIDEADQLFRHRGYTQKKQSEILPNCWQLAKMGNTLIYTDHRGRGVDLILRDATTIAIEPHIDHKESVLVWDIIDSRYRAEDGRDLRYQARIEAIYYLYESYERRAPVT